MDESTKKITPAIDLLLPSMNVIKQNPLTYFVLSVIPMLLVTVGTKEATTLNDLITPLSAIGSLLSIIFFAPLTYTMLKTAKGKNVELSEAFRKGLPFFWRLLALSIILGFLILGGLLLLIVPGIIVLRRYYLSFYYLIDGNLDVKQAMKKSAESSKKNSGAIYGIIAISILFGFTGVIGGLGVAVGTILQFLYSVAPALRYTEMKKVYH